MSASSYAAVNGGTDNVITNDVAGDGVNVTSGTTTTIEGTGGSFGVFGTDAVVNASGESADTWSGVSFDLVGDNNQVSLGEDSAMSLSGTNNIVTVTGDPFESACARFLLRDTHKIKSSVGLDSGNAANVRTVAC